MQCIEFTTEELEVLREVLQHKLKEAGVEMFRTDTHDFKQMLKHRQEVMEHVLAKLSTPVSLASVH
jgi:hypothetical protein